MFRFKSRKRGWLDEMRRQIESQEAEITAGIELCQRELDEAPALIERQINEMEQERINNAGLIRPTGSLNGPLSDPRHPWSGWNAASDGRDDQPRPIRAVRRRKRMIAMLQFLVLAAILAGCLLLLITLNADPR